jgi:FHS family Na+ dependent glucose MFS transporter 1
MQNSMRTLRLPQVGMYFLIMCGVGLAGVLIGPTLPYLAQQLDVTLDQISILFLVRSLGGVLGAFGVARAYDRVPGHWLLGVALGLTSLLAFAVPAIRSLVVMQAVFFVAGVCDALLHVGLNTMLIWGLRDRLAPAMNGMHFMFGVGAILAPLLVARVLLTTGAVAWAYYAVTLIMAALALSLLAFPSPPDPQSDVETNGSSKSSSPGLAVLFVFFFIAYVGGEVGFSSWLYTYSVETGLTDAIGAAVLNSLFWGTFTLGRLISIALAIHFRPRSLLWANLTLLFSALISMLLFPAASWWSVAGIGLAYASMFPQAIAWAERRLKVTGKINGWFLGGANFSAMLVPWLIGLMFVGIGPRSLIWTTLFMAGLIVLVMALLSAMISDQLVPEKIQGVV